VPDPRADEQIYAWNWFALHSGQRMQLVNFWLVAVAFLGAAFVQARTGNLPAIAVGVCFAGAVASIAFAMLDARTRRLVQVAEEALRGIEEARASAGEPTLRLVSASHQARPSRLLSYRVIIQGMQVTIAGLFVVAAVLTMSGI
jgi:hypothetical protein